MLNGPILALDADEDVYAVVTYQLLGAHSDLFVIDNSTGEGCAADYEPILWRDWPRLGSRTVVLNMWVSTPLGAKWPFHRDHISDILPYQIFTS